MSRFGAETRMVNGPRSARGVPRRSLHCFQFRACSTGAKPRPARSALAAGLGGKGSIGRLGDADPGIAQEVSEVWGDGTLAPKQAPRIRTTPAWHRRCPGALLLGLHWHSITSSHKSPCGLCGHGPLSTHLWPANCLDTDSGTPVSTYRDGAWVASPLQQSCLQHLRIPVSLGGRNFP